MAEPTRKLKVCVVGAGAAGLCAGRHLAPNSNFEVKIYEQTNDVGGTWVYTETTGLDENGLPVHSSMYRDLRTNLPAKTMNFPDYMEMNAVEPCYVTHQEVRAYLQNYASHFDILKHIQYNTRVESVRLETVPEGGDRWIVRVKSLKTRAEEVIRFDAVMVCNGHYFEPYVPPVPGIETYTGTIIHSHSYRKWEDFSGRTVLILGASSSGIDIALDLADHAPRVYLSHNNDRLNSPLPSNVVQAMGVERIEGERILLRDQSSVTADVFMFCTGYRNSFPFLDENCGIRVDSNYVTPLYKHLINIDHPTMCIVGIPTVVLPFPTFHMQVKYFLALLEKRATLPSRSVMMENSKLKTEKKRHAHKLMDKQWDYHDSLADDGGFERLPKLFKIGYNLSAAQRKADLRHYKKAKFVVSENGESAEMFLPN